MKPRFFPFVWRMISRRPLHALLTIGGVATAMFLFALIRSLQAGVAEATENAASDTSLVVYRENRFCPFTSNLPEDYEARIRSVPGVAEVTPMKIVVSNCRTSLDVVTYRGVRPARFANEHEQDLRVVAGSWQDWMRRTDAALVGDTLAARRGLSVGQRFEANGIAVTVAAVFKSDAPQHRNVAYVDLEFLQRAPGAKGDGVVTQFNVRVDDPQRAEDVAAAIDAEFENAQEPTHTSPEQAFVARAAADAVALIGFTQWVAYGCIAAVIALVANAIVLSVHDRVRDIAVLQTLGYRSGLVARLIVSEGVLMGVLGGVVGGGGAALLLGATSFAISNEGVSIPAEARPREIVLVIALAAVLGAVAGVVPAWRAGRRPITESFRAV